MKIWFPNENILFVISTEGRNLFSFPCSSVGMHTIWVPTLEHGNQAYVLDAGLGLPRTGYGVRHDVFGTFYETIKLDEFVKSRKISFPVIPAKAGIQYFQVVAEHLDSGFHRSDDFLRIHQA